MTKNSASGCRTEIRTVLPGGKETRHYLAIYVSLLLKIHHTLFFAYKVCICKLYDSKVSNRDLYYIYDSVIPSIPKCTFFNDNVDQSLSDFCSLLMVLISRKIPEN
jgi:hypothetical protein